MGVAVESNTLLVIGGGVGGYTAAIRAAREGMRVRLIEKAELGGTCLNEGCIPTKSLLHQAHQFKALRAAAARGMGSISDRVNFAEVDAQKMAVVQQLVQGVQGLIRRNRIELIRGTAEFVDAHTVRVRESGTLLRAGHILIATGSQPVRPAVAGMDLPGVIDSSGALAMKELPGSILVLGGGVVGVEFAQIFSQFGVAVTLVESQDRLLAQEDPETVAVLQRQLLADGVMFHLGASVERIEVLSLIHI